MNATAILSMILPFRITVRGSDWQSRNSDTGEALVEFCYAIYNFVVIYRLQRVCWYGRDRLELFILSKNMVLCSCKIFIPIYIAFNRRIIWKIWKTFTQFYQLVALGEGRDLFGRIRYRWRNDVKIGIKE